MGTVLGCFSSFKCLLKVLCKAVPFGMLTLLYCWVFKVFVVNTCTGSNDT